jgi:hypothetical protein
MRAIVGILAIAVTLFVAANAAAATASQKFHKSETVVAWYEGKGHWTLRPHYAKCAQLPGHAADRCYRHRLNYRWHRARVVRFAPRPQLSHLAGWLCIHSREGAWDANTGNGYYGGLQMSYGWLGLIAGRASDLSPLQQMAAAEGGYNQSRNSHAWLAGQWPNTYPPCAGYF